MCIEHRWWHQYKKFLPLWNCRVPEDFANTNCALPRMQLMTDLTPVVELPIKGAVLLSHHPIPAVFSSLLTILLSDTGSFVEWLCWSGWKLGLVQVLGFFWWADFQVWSLTCSDVLSRHKSTELTQGTELKTHEKRTASSVQMRPRSWQDLIDMDATTWHRYIFHAVPCTVWVCW